MAFTFTANAWEDYIVHGTGNASVDNAVFASAVARINARGRGRIVIDGDCHINSAHVITAQNNVCLTGTPGSWITTDGANAEVDFGGYFYPWSMSPVAISSMNARTSVLTSASLALDPGDLVILWADNNLSGLTPHGAGIINRPAEIHRISRGVIGAATQYVFGDIVFDPLTSSPQLSKYSAACKNIRVTDLQFKHKPATAINATTLHFGGCNNVICQNLYFAYPSGGRLECKGAYNVQILGCRFEDVLDVNTNLSNSQSYGISLALCNRVNIEHCSFTGRRHGTTTGAIERTISSVNYRYGTVRNCRIANNVFANNGQQLNSSTWTGTSSCDTHSESVGLVIEGNTFSLPGDVGDNTPNIGITNRGRGTIARSNHFIGTPGISKPIANYGPDFLAADNTFDGGWFCTSEDNGNNPNVDNSRWIGNIFQNMWGPGIKISTGTGHVIDRNTFLNCGFNASGSLPKAPIHVPALSNAGTLRITDNLLERTANELSVALGSGIAASQVKIAGNRLLGYDTTSGGLRSRSWMPGESITAGDYRWANGNEYRANNSSTTVSISPNHSSGTAYDGAGNTGVQWAFMRAVPIAAIQEIEATQNTSGLAAKLAVVQQTAHGLTNADRYKLIAADHTVLDDTLVLQSAAGLLMDVISEDAYVLATGNTIVEVPKSIVGTYSVGSGRRLYWDASVGRFSPSLPGDSAPDAAPALDVTSYSTNYMQVRVLAGTAVAAPDRLHISTDLGPLSGTYVIDFDTLAGDIVYWQASGNLTVGVTNARTGPYYFAWQPGAFDVVFDSSLVEYQVAPAPAANGYVAVSVVKFN